MNETNLPPTQPEPSPTETVSPEVSFLRGFLSRVSQFLSTDEKLKLSGSARLVAELLDSTGKVFLLRAEHEQLLKWKQQADALQKVHLDHTNTAADQKFNEQLATLHSKVGQPDHTASAILSREELRQKYEQVRTSARIAQQKLYSQNIQLARQLAYRAEEILLADVAGLEASEKERFARFGLPFTGSPFVHATRAAAKFVVDRVAADEGTGAPADFLPWLIL